MSKAGDSGAGRVRSGRGRGRETGGRAGPRGRTPPGGSDAPGGGSGSGGGEADAARNPGPAGVAGWQDLYLRMCSVYLSEIQRIMAAGYGTGGSSRPGGSGPDANPGAGPCMLASSLEAWRRGAAGTGEGGAPPDAPGAELPVLMGQAFVAWSSSGMRILGRLAEVYGRCCGSLAWRGPGAGGEGGGSAPGRRVMMDDARACIRELADLADRESRRLQSELEAIEGRIRSLGEGEDEARRERPHRYAKAKD